MTKIETKDHKHLVAIFNKYKKLYELYGDSIVSEEQDESIRHNAIELQETYDYYQTLIVELEKCIQHYYEVRSSLKSTMYSPVRKMTTISKKKNW